MQNSPLNLADPRVKLATARQVCGLALEHPAQFTIPGANDISRNVKVVSASELPPKKGLSLTEAQARLLHDLTSIEMQAMELCFRTLIEFPDAPVQFREELSRILLSEADHLELCLDGLEHFQKPWGSWPVHIALWQSCTSTDSLIDRVLIVHRYLEGSGLDAGDTILQKLMSQPRSPVETILRTIVREEIGHVQFGTRWYRELCKLENIDPQNDFAQRTEKLRFQVPKRMEKLSWELRKTGGFTEAELEFLESYRDSLVAHSNKGWTPKSANQPKRDFDSIRLDSKPHLVKMMQG